MLNAKNDYCIALDQLPKGCYDIRESEGENVLYSVDQGEWSRSARVIIDDARVHEVRILNLNEPRTGTIRIEKLVENDRCVLMQPERSEYFQVCISSSQMRRMITLNAANQWCVYVDELPYAGADDAGSQDHQYPASWLYLEAGCTHGRLRRTDHLSRR